MEGFLLLISVIIFVSVLLNNASLRVGVPVLFAFIMLGIIFGYNGLIPLNLDEQAMSSVGKISSVALIFIMFYGGFGTSWRTARSVATEAGLLSTVGVVVTAGLVAVFCHYILSWRWLESLLLGSVLSSTDAASVFSILRSKKLGLKNNTAPLLEMESGSNDPMSYLLTVIILSLYGGAASPSHAVWMFIAQIGFGVLFGLCIATFAVFALRRINFVTSGFNSLFLVAVAIASYALPSIVGGNGYLSAYIVGIILGNQQIEGKKQIVHFFDGITSLMQLILFFLLGLLALPSNLERCIIPALSIFLFLSLVARPLSVGVILSPFRKWSLRHQTLISFCGLRGAASIVFAIMAVTSGYVFKNDVFNIVFCVVLLSILIQGSLIPFTARKLEMLDNDSDVMKTFNDFSDDVSLQFSCVEISSDNPWADKKIMDLCLPKEFLICQIIRSDGKRELPSGNTVLGTGDRLVICSSEFIDSNPVRIKRHVMSDSSKWDNRKISELPHDNTIMLVMRGRQAIIPHGDTVLHSKDILYINDSD